MEWSSKQKQDAELQLQAVKVYTENLKLIAYGNPAASREGIDERFNEVVKAADKLHDMVILLGQAYQAQKAAILKSTIAMVDKIGEEEEEPEPVKPKLTPPKFTPIIKVWNVIVAFIAAYLVPSLVWQNWFNWEDIMVVCCYFVFLLTAGCFCFINNHKRMVEETEWEIKNSSGGHP